MTAYKIRIGQFIQDQYNILRGNISGLGIGSTDVISEDVKDREGKTYFKLIADPLGSAYEIGVAFPKEKNDVGYYSVILESPIFDTPLYAGLFPDRQREDVYNLIWQRPLPLKPSLEQTKEQSILRDRSFKKPTSALEV